MTLRLGIRKIQGIRSLKEVQQKRFVSGFQNQYRNKDDSKNDNSNKQHNGNFKLYCTGVGGIAAIIAGNSAFQYDLNAEEKEEIDIEQEIIDKENRIRQYSRIGTIFDYFSTYETQTPKGRTTVVMSVKDFYNACTPWSTITHGVGRGTYTLLTKEDITSARTYEVEKLPPKPDGRYSVLNEIQMYGMLTFQDFVFLLHLLSTPRRYLDIGFHCFDVSADGNVDAKEFAHVMAAITDYKGNLSDLTNCEYSGLMNYLFGKNRDKKIKREDFIRLQRDLIDDIMWLEFCRYSKDGSTISDLDLCNHLLCSANLTTKQRRQMIYRVKRDVEGNSLVGRITYEAFKNFYLVLFGGTDLERAMFFLDTEKKGVNSKEFMSIAKWVANCDIDRHIVDVIYALLDDNRDGNLSIKEFSPVLYQWRRSRGFEHATLRINMGNLSV